MIRALLVNPPSPERTGAPLLGLQYVAAALMARGCEVRAIDAAARYFEGGDDAVAAQAQAWAPDLIGIALFTRRVRHAYRLAGRLAGSCRMLAAGGPHATVRADEALDHGFDVAVRGEAELVMPALAEHLEGRRPLDSIPGIRFRAPDGERGEGPPAAVNNDLDALPAPVSAQGLFDPRWYGHSGAAVIPGGVMASRGCPARCVFCANYVTGRKARFRSAAGVTAELRAWHAWNGTTVFAFWDDAFGADPGRVASLCEAFRRDLDFPLRWSAITRANMMTPELLRMMRRSGCMAVTIGIESGDDRTLRAIRKGVTTEQAARALRQAKNEGLATAANFMLGFPQETPDALRRTLDYMRRIAPLVDSFSTLGVVTPFPGTPLYDDHHRAYGFTDWWLREEYSRYDAPPADVESDEFYRYYTGDPTLNLDFFRYSDAARDLIRECLKFKAEHNLRGMGVMRDRVSDAAGVERAG